MKVSHLKCVILNEMKQAQPKIHKEDYRMPELILISSILVVVFIVLGWMVATMNGFKHMLIKIDESETSIDVALTKRFAILTKVVSATKGYVKHEIETFEKIINLRQPKHEATMMDKEAFANEVSRGFQTLRVTVEQYPDLKQSQHVLKLQDAIIEAEENLQASRRIYNSNVSYYNQKVVIFPSNLIANWKKYQKRLFFEAEAMKREDVKIEI